MFLLEYGVTLQSKNNRGTIIWNINNYQWQHQVESRTCFPNLDLSVPRPFAIVGAFDVNLNYVKVLRAINWLRDPGVPFLLTNEDATFPDPDPPEYPELPATGTVGLLI